MPLTSPKYPFTKTAVSGAPDDPGVYALYCENELLYVGAAERAKRATIRSRLIEHFSGEREPTGATHYKWEIRSDPLARLAELSG